MTRETWNRLWITAMAALIVFGVQEMWRSPEPWGEFRYMFSISLAVLVIVLKLRELRQAQQKPGSRA